MEQIKFINKLGRISPKRLAESWDHVGYQTGVKDSKRDVKKVLLCLDFSEIIFDKALQEKPDLILTHHPFIFGSKKRVFGLDPLKADLDVRICSELNCPVYSFHTNFDSAVGGINDTLMSFLDVHDVKIAKDGMMRLATLDQPMTISELCLHLKDRLELPYLFYNEGMIKEICKIAVIAGGGSSFYHDAIEQGADCYISGDCPQHNRLDIRRYQINYIDIAHEVEEKAFIVGMKKIINAIDPKIEVVFAFYEKNFEIVR
ncbi:MAG: Nif3-like dinuclear metal center hexameric protein [Bacilli bacterium]